MKELGRSVGRVDAIAKVTGSAKYSGDINLPDQVYMKVVFSNRPPARIRHVGTKGVRDVPGVLLVLTAKDVPNNERGLHHLDCPVLCGPGSAKLHPDRTRTYG